MTNRNEGITIYLTIGKEVKLNFDSENNLSSIRLSINKVAELFGNKVVNEESIFYVSTVALVTKSNYKTFISVVGGKQVISGDAVYEEVKMLTLKHKKSLFLILGEYRNCYLVFVR
ncbi:hypothetical protein SGC_02590 [Enterococcus faecium EnGen0136]|nr:hypothetical protein SGC_02590 [Enterococcus faecium EnGen0136]